MSTFVQKWISQYNVAELARFQYDPTNYYNIAWNVYTYTVYTALVLLSKMGLW